MSDLVLSRPLLAFVVGTRAALALGVGLLVADRLPAERRRTIAMSLICFGAVTTVPAVKAVFGQAHRARAAQGQAA